MKKEKRVLSKKERIREMTILAMFIAIIVVMAFVPYIGFITIGPLSATIIHIPVLIGAVLLGRKGGVILGLTFGIASLIRGATSGGFDFVFIFPWVSVLPRFIFGLIIYDVYRFFKKIIKVRIVALAVSFAILTLIHSLMVLPMIVSTFPIIINNASLGDIVGGDALGTMTAIDTFSSAMQLIWSFLIAFSLIEILFAAVIGSVVADRLIQYLQVNKNPAVKLEE